MIYDEEDYIISTDMYVKQERYDDTYPTDDVEYHITDYNKPQIQDTSHYNSGPWSDNGHLVFDVPRLPEREW
tara:strand:+ start:302 stop:517 length:216 start_codon:yes stop_codon:yes gene_type:complete